jgi:hypothetical protein
LHAIKKEAVIAKWKRNHRAGREWRRLCAPLVLVFLNNRRCCAVEVQREERRYGSGNGKVRLCGKLERF